MALTTHEDLQNWTRYRALTRRAYARQHDFASHGLVHSLGGCEWILRRQLREQWASLDPAERAQVHALVDRFPLQNPVVEVATITTRAAAWMLFAMAWCGVSHPRSLFQKPLHPPTELVRWISRFSLEQQTSQAVEIQRRFAGDLRVAAVDCGLMVRRMANRTGRVALLRELCEF